MRSILTVTEAAESVDLVTLSMLKQALGISGSSQDTNLARLISAASQSIITYLGRQIVRETVAETFRPDQGERVEVLLLTRYPVATITSAVEDGETVPSAEYECPAESGMLYRLSASDTRSCWSACSKIVVTYQGGYITPGNSGANLPADLEHAVTVLVQSFMSATGRDPMLKEEEIDGVGRFSYWIGSTGGVPGALPPDVLSRVDFYRETRIA